MDDAERKRKRAEANKQWRLAHPNYRKSPEDRKHSVELKRRWRKAHPERARQSSYAAAKKWRSKDPGLTRQRDLLQKKRWLLKDPERAYKVHSKASRKAKYKSQYGLTIEEYEKLVILQEGLCAICKIRPEKTRLHIDHDHVTGKVRGLLCSACNPGLGYFHDSILVLQAAIDYLKRTT